MAKTTEDARSQVEEPLEEIRSAAGAGGLRRAAMTAGAAAIAGGLAGAVQELLSRRGDHEIGIDEAEEDEPSAEAEPDERGGEPSAEVEEDEQAEDDEYEEEDEDESDAEEEPVGEGDEGDEEAAQESSPRDGAPPGRAAELVRAARRQIEELISEPESVSGMRRTEEGWAVTFEVVEVHRIPETTDVLSSYEVRVDDDGNLLDLERKRRYRRSQVDDS
jgi:Gas vesicle synthesis protein GvpO